jgi:hypothetical protein
MKLIDLPGGWSLRPRQEAGKLYIHLFSPGGDVVSAMTLAHAQEFAAAMNPPTRRSWFSGWDPWKKPDVIAG